MSDIQLFDNFLNDNDLKYVKHYIQNNHFYFGHLSGERDRELNLFFSTNIDDDFFLTYLKQKIEDAVHKKFILNRNYMHIQTSGLDGCFHTDDDRDDSYTFCLYITDLDNDTIDLSSGELFIKIPNKKHIVLYEPYNNRGIFFKASYLHKGNAYNFQNKYRRLCITWKLILQITN